MVWSTWIQCKVWEGIRGFLLRVNIVFLVTVARGSSMTGHSRAVLGSELVVSILVVC